MSVMADMTGNREALDGIYLEATLSSRSHPCLPDINRCFLDILLMASWRRAARAHRAAVDV